MKLNNKGFAITGILYGLLILFALLVGSYLTVLTARKNRLDGIVENIENEYNGNTTDTYTLTLKRCLGVEKIYYKINEASDYTSTTSNSITLDVQAETTYYYYGTASSGYTMNSCTSSSPCSGTMGMGTITEQLTATTTVSGSFVVSLYVDDDSNGSTTVSGGSKYEQSFMAPTSSLTCNCTNGQSCYIRHSTGNYYIITINSVTANTTCNVEY